MYCIVADCSGGDCVKCVSRIAVHESPSTQEKHTRTDQGDCCQAEAFLVPLDPTLTGGVVTVPARAYYNALNTV